MANDGSDDWGSEYAFYGIDRIGAFLEQQTNMTTTIETIFRMFSGRWLKRGRKLFCRYPHGFG